MTDALVAFVKARLDDDAQVAREACHDLSGEWTTQDTYPVAVVEDPESGDAFAKAVAFDEGSPSEQQAAHIARQDPARTLREVEAKRQLVGIFEIAVRNEALPHPEHIQGVYPPAVFISGYRAALEYTLRCFAALHADHPDYQADWAPWEAENA
ncbi:DUF6221 family protein [Streptomyces cyaneofuscatus]